MTPRPRLPKRMFAAAMVGVLVLVSAVGVAIWATDRAAEISALEDLNDARAADIARLSDSLDESRGQLEEHGIEPETPPPEEVVGESDADEPVPELSDAQVQRVLDRWCAANDCTEPPRPLDVARAIAAYCDARGECRGAEGEDGEDGTDGEPGRDADPVTAELLDATVDRYCASRDGCRGPQGEPGEDGADGQPGQDGADGVDGAPGPACPDGAAPIEWLVDEARSVVIGLPPDTYVLCRAA